MIYRLKTTGETIDVVAYSGISGSDRRSHDDYVRYIDDNGEVRQLSGINIYLDCEPIDERQVFYLHEQFRAEAAKDILCAMIGSSTYLFGEGTIEKHVNRAVMFADTLIEKLKK